MSLKLKWVIPILIVYSLFIMAIEYKLGQNYVRHYLTDLKGPVLLFGIHTTITTVLLSIISYQFVLTYCFAKGINESNKRFKFFFLFQAVLFLILAFDDRFMLHERIAYVLGFHDAIPLLILAFSELAVLLYFKEIKLKAIKWNSPLILGSICFAIMIIIDVFAPLHSTMRLSIEDLFKLWGIFFLFNYACKTYIKWVHPSNANQLKEPNL